MYLADPYEVPKGKILTYSNCVRKRKQTRKHHIIEIMTRLLNDEIFNITSLASLAKNVLKRISNNLLVNSNFN